MGPASGQRSRSQPGARTLVRQPSGALLPSRPVRVDLSGNPGEDPLAPVPGWGVEFVTGNGSSMTAAGTVGTGGALSELVDKAGAQLIVLRRSLDEAVASDRVVRQHLADLTQRLQQGQRFATEFDRRLTESGRAASVLEKAASTLRGLEGVVEQLRSSQAQLEQRMQQRLAEQAEAFAKRMLELESTFQSRLEEMQTRVQDAARASEAQAEQMRQDAERRIELSRTAITERADALMAQVDRHAAQAQARVSLILDGASDRLAVMEEQAEHLGGSSRQRLDELCAQAVELLGHDPRRDGPAPADPVPGSLAHAVTQARELIDTVDDAGIRITAIKSEAAAGIQQMDAARREVEAVIQSTRPVQTELAVRIDEVLAQARAGEEQLRTALEQQRQAAEAATRASEQLSRQREDLEAIGSASAYHVAQAREAASSLGARLETADVRIRELDHAMEQVTLQAQSMVELARRVASLVEQSRPGENGSDRAGDAPAQAA